MDGLLPPARFPVCASCGQRYDRQDLEAFAHHGPLAHAPLALRRTPDLSHTTLRLRMTAHMRKFRAEAKTLVTRTEKLIGESAAAIEACRSLLAQLDAAGAKGELASHRNRERSLL